MRLMSAHIKNFRAISDLKINFVQHTVLVGPNGVGKSCILKALDKFFSKSSAVSIEDFHEKNTADEIQIILSFDSFSDEEQEVFSSRIHGDHMTVARIFGAGVSSKDNGKFFGLSLRKAELQAVRAVEGATPRRVALNELAGSGEFIDLAPAKNAAELDASMEVWESTHPDQCELLRDDGQFLGFSNVARGSLSKYLSFVFVPAVRDAGADATDAKNSVIAQLIELLVKSVVQKRKEIVDWRLKVSEEYKDLVKPENLGELSGLSEALSETLGMFYGDARVDLAWTSPEDVEFNLPAATVALTEQGYSGPIVNKGHGLQRAFIFTLLQHLAKALSEQTSDEGEGGQAPIESEGVGEVISDAGENPSHTVILAIEEPELYQHPIKQRHLARVLREISAGSIVGVMSRTQIMLCSHSPHFVSTEHFDEIRLARREALQADGPLHCVLGSLSYAIVNSALDGAYLSAVGSHTEESLKARLHVLDEGVSEGFFSDVAVVVEGVGDRAALLAVADAKGIDLTAKGIAVLPVGGKGNIDKAVAIFSQLGIPTYAVFDSDQDKNPGDQHPNQNLAIQYLSGEENPVEFRTHVGDRFASFLNNLNSTLKADLGASYDDQATLVAIDCGMKKKNAEKNPVALSKIVRRCLDNGGTCDMIGAVVDKVVALAE